MRPFPLILLLSAAWLGGCATYRPAPFEPERHASAWADRAKEAGPKLSLAAAERVALLFNPDLRLARAGVGEQTAGADHAGLLDDPALSAGVGRNLAGGASPWLVEGGLAVTLPLSDRLQVEKKNAQWSLTAAQAQVVAQEAQVVREVRTVYARWMGAQARASAWEGQEERLRVLKKRLEALVQAGTVPVYEADVVDFSIVQARANGVAAEAQVTGERLRILALCGLRPECPVQLEIGEGKTGLENWLKTSGRKSERSGVAAYAVSSVDHPARLAAQAEFDTAESALQLEVAKSRPELSLGPTGKRENGETTLGIGLGLSLPIWNRNQKAIAQAAARRESARIALEKTIESLAHGAAQSFAKTRGAAAKLDLISGDMQPLLERQTATIDRLIQLGEFDPLRLMGLLDRRVAWELSLADAAAEWEEAWAETSYFIYPLPHREAVPVPGQGRSPWKKEEADRHPEGVEHK